MYLIKNTFKYNSQLFKFYAYRVEAVVISITPRQRQKTWHGKEPNKKLNKRSSVELEKKTPYLW